MSTAEADHYLGRPPNKLAQVARCLSWGCARVHCVSYLLLTWMGPWLYNRSVVGSLLRAK